MDYYEQQFREKADDALRRARKVLEKAEARGGESESLTPHEKRVYDRAWQDYLNARDDLQERKTWDGPIVGPRADFDTDDGGSKMRNETPRYTVRTDRGRELRSYEPGESVYEARKAEEGWDDYWDEISLGDWLLARDVRGPQTEAEERAITASNVALPDPVEASWIDTLMEGSLVGQLGIPTVPMESDTQRMVRVADGGDVGGSWKAEASTHSSTDVTLETVTFNAKSRTAVLKIGRETFDDALGLSEGLERSFNRMLTRGLNDAIMVGGGANEPSGISQQSSGTIAQTAFSGSTGGATPASSGSAWGEIVRAREALVSRELRSDNLRMITTPRTARQFFSLKDKNNQPLQKPGVLRDIPLQESISVASTLSSTNGAGTGHEIVLGDFAQGVAVGVRLDPEIRVIDASLADDWTISVVGGARWDVAFPRPDALQRLLPVTT